MVSDQNLCTIVFLSCSLVRLCLIVLFHSAKFDVLSRTSLESENLWSRIRQIEQSITYLGLGDDRRSYLTLGATPKVASRSNLCGFGAGYVDVVRVFLWLAS